MTTTNMSLNEPSVGVTTGPTWATQTNSNWETIDTHDHTSGKGVQLTPSALNINADLEFNQNSATELKNVIFDSSVTAATTNYSVYQDSGNLYWRNGSGTAVQITDGSGINTSGGSISNMTGNSQVQFSGVNKSYTFKFDSTLSDGIAKLVMSDIQLYFYNGGSATTRSVNLKYTGSGTGANTLTVPDETGTLLSTATSFAGVINIATSSSNAAINLKPNGTGHVVVGNGSATGKLTSNGAYDLVLDTNSGTNSGNITITDAANGNITFAPNGTGEIVIGSGSASGKITSNGAYDLVLDTNAGTDSGNITITDGANGAITITPNGTGAFTIGGNWTATSQTCADLGTVTTADINGGTWQGTIDGSWTAAGQTCADLGSVTTCDINGGTINGITDLAVADGGTGASSASDARTNLGVAIGSDVQAYDADLAAIAGLAKSDGNFIVGNGSAWVAESGSTARASLGLAIGTDVFTQRTITGTTNEITVSNGDGVSGNPTISLPSRIDVSEVRASSSSGLKLYDDSGTGGIFVEDGGSISQNGSFSTSNTYDDFFWNTGTGGRFRFHSGTTSSRNILEFSNTNGPVGAIETNNSSTSYLTSSDYRLKENVRKLTGAIDRLNQLKPSRFNFIANPDTTMDGFLAHEVSDYVPEAVSGEKDAVDENGEIKRQSLDLSKLVPLLVAAVQELSKKIT